MENFLEKFAELKEFIHHSGQQDLADCVDYIGDVILPFSDKMEKICTQYYEDLFELDCETKENIDNFKKGVRIQKKKETRKHFTARQRAERVKTAQYEKEPSHRSD
jgi:hypothetical protein